MAIKFEKPERIKEAETDYSIKHGVKRIGNKEVFDADRTEHGIQICSESITTWYFGNKEPEPLKGIRMCVTIPDEFLMQIKREFDPPANPVNKEMDLRQDYDEKADVVGGTLYRKGSTIQAWWGPGWGKETWTSDVENAKRNFIEMKERWS